MPSLVYQIPKSDYAKLELAARREGVSVRTLVLWRLREWVRQLAPDSEQQAAA